MLNRITSMNMTQSLTVGLKTTVALVVLATWWMTASGCAHAAANGPSNASQTQPATQAATQPSTQPAIVLAALASEDHGTLGPVPEPKGQPVFIHMVTSLEKDDNPGCVAFNVALEALKQGRPVVMCFDAGAVTDLKVWKGGPTALRYELPEKLLRMLARRYGVAADRLPKTYQQYLYALRDSGATVAANGFMAELVDLTDDPAKPGQLEPIVQMWSLQQIMVEREKAATYLRY